MYHIIITFLLKSKFRGNLKFRMQLLDTEARFSVFCCNSPHVRPEPSTGSRDLQCIFIININVNNTVVCPNKHPPPSENLAYWGGGPFCILVFLCLTAVKIEMREGGGVLISKSHNARTLISTRGAYEGTPL